MVVVPSPSPAACASRPRLQLAGAARRRGRGRETLGHSGRPSPLPGLRRYAPPRPRPGPECVPGGGCHPLYSAVAPRVDRRHARPAVTAVEICRAGGMTPSSFF